MIGVVQDHASNKGYLSNRDGQLVFDVLLCPMGIFVYSATSQIIDKWIELEDDLDMSQCREYMKQMDPKFPLRSYNNKTSEFIELVKDKIHNTLNDSNPFWASEENSLMNNAFNKYIGSWYYMNRGEGLFSTQILSKFNHLGYQYWWERDLPKSRTKSKTVVEITEETTSAFLAEKLTLSKQLEFFTSKEFLSIDYATHPLLLDYLTTMRKMGFYIQYFGWNVQQVDFVYAH